MSKNAADLDQNIHLFLSRPIDIYIPYFKVWDGVWYINKALLVITGIRSDGFREILVTRIADCEDELSGEDLFSNLKDRWLEKVDLVISDSTNGYRL